MAGPYQRLSNGQSADSGAQAITTVVNAVEAGLEDAEAAIEAAETAIAGKSSTSHTHTGVYDPAGSAATAQAAAVQRANHTGTQLASTISDFNTAVRTNRLDQLLPPTTAVGMGSQKITGLGTPTASTDAVTKAYADALTGATPPAGPFVYASDYGVRMNGAHAVLRTTSGSSTISSQNVGYYGADFKASDVGSTIRLNSGCFSQSVVTRTIATVASDGTSITVSGGTIPFTSNLVIAEWSADSDAAITANTTAMQDCIDDAQGRTILLEPGTAIFDGGFTLKEGTRFRGAGVAHRLKLPPTASGVGGFATCLMLKRGVDATMFYAGTGCNGITFDDVMAWGTTNPSTTNYTVHVVGPADGYQVNTLFRNARLYGGNRVFRAENTSVGVVQGGIFGGGRTGGVQLVNSPDWAFLNADVHQYTNWEHTGTAPGASGTCYDFDSNSGANTMIGCYVEFGEFGVACGSNENTFLGNRFSDSRDCGLALIGNNNTVTGNLFIEIPPGWGGYTTGSRCGVWVGGSYNTIQGNTYNNVAGNIQKAVRFYTTATYNKLITGAPRYTNEDLGTGNVII